MTSNIFSKRRHKQAALQIWILSSASLHIQQKWLAVIIRTSDGFCAQTLDWVLLQQPFVKNTKTLCRSQKVQYSTATSLFKLIPVLVLSAALLQSYWWRCWTQEPSIGSAYKSSLAQSNVKFTSRQRRERNRLNKPHEGNDCSPEEFFSRYCQRTTFFHSFVHNVIIFIQFLHRVTVIQFCSRHLICLLCASRWLVDS